MAVERRIVNHGRSASISATWMDDDQYVFKPFEVVTKGYYPLRYRSLGKTDRAGKSLVFQHKRLWSVSCLKPPVDLIVTLGSMDEKKSHLYKVFTSIGLFQQQKGLDMRPKR